MRTAACHLAKADQFRRRARTPPAVAEASRPPAAIAASRPQATEASRPPLLQPARPPYPRPYLPAAAAPPPNLKVGTREGLMVIARMVRRW